MPQSLVGSAVHASFFKLSVRHADAAHPPIRDGLSLASLAENDGPGLRLLTLAVRAFDQKSRRGDDICLAKQSQFKCSPYRCPSRMDLELAVDTLHMTGDRICRYAQSFADLCIGVASSKELQHVSLSRGESDAGIHNPSFRIRRSIALRPGAHGQPEDATNGLRIGHRWLTSRYSVWSPQLAAPALASGGLEPRNRKLVSTDRTHQSPAFRQDPFPICG